MLKTTVDSTVWMAAVPRSSCLMVADSGLSQEDRCPPSVIALDSAGSHLVISPVLRMRWNCRSRWRVWENSSMLIFLHRASMCHHWQLPGMSTIGVQDPNRAALCALGRRLTTCVCKRYRVRWGPYL